MKTYIALLLAGLLLLGGCASQPAQPSEPDPDSPVLTETLPGAVSLAVETTAGFDPYGCQSASNRLVLELVTQPLFRVTETGEPVAVLAKGWSVSPDGMTTTIHLREDVSFHNGTAFSAQQAADCIRRAADSDFYGGRFVYLKNVTAQDAHTLVLETGKAYECLPKLLDIPMVLGQEELPVGTGLYMWSGTEKLKKSPTWQDETAAEEIALVPVTDAFSLRNGFQYGGISAVTLDPNAPNALTYGGDYELWGVPTTVLQYLGFNLKSGPFSNGGLRSAVTYAVDRETIVREDMAGFGVSAPLATLPGSAQYSEELHARCVFDPKMLAGIVNPGTSVTMLVSDPGSQRAKTAQRIAGQLEDCGFSVDLQVLPPEDFRSALSRGAYDLYYAEAKLSPDLDLAPFFRDGGRLAYGGLSGFGNLQSLCDLSRANAGNAYDLQKTILTDGVLCPVAFKQTALYLHRDVFHGVETNLNGWISLS